MKHWLITIVLISASAACAIDQTPSEYVEAIEIPLDVGTERRELVRILEDAARGDPEIHVDDVSDEYAEWHDEIEMRPIDQRPTIFVSIWRGDEDDQLVATIDDLGHRGRVWATFSRGENPALERPFRDRALAAIRERWPETLDLPVLSGGLSNPDHWVLTPEGYKIRQSEAEKYEQPEAPELIAPG